MLFAMTVPTGSQVFDQKQPELLQKLKTEVKSKSAPIQPKVEYSKRFFSKRSSTMHGKRVRRDNFKRHQRASVRNSIDRDAVTQEQGGLESLLNLSNIDMFKTSS